MGTGDGELHVLDAATGRTLWRVDLAEKQIEADPTPADLDGDGLLDVLVADHDSNLHAIDGRAIAPGLRRR